MTDELKDEIIVVDNNAPTTYQQETNIINTGVFDLPDPVEVARRAEQSKKMLAAACSVLSYSDITMQGDKPYIDHYGCKKIANLFGLIVRQNEANGRIDYQKTIIDEKTNHYIISITGKVWHAKSPENYEIYEGTADSFDDFYRQYQIVEEYTDENGKKKKRVVSAQTLPVNKVQEKATANLMQKAIKKKLGLQFTKEELEQFGFDMNKVKGFNFGGGKAPDSLEVVEKKKDVWNKLVELCGGDTEQAKNTLKKHTAFNDFEGHSDINKVSEKQLEFLSKKVDKKYNEHLKKLEGNMDGNS